MKAQAHGVSVGVAAFLSLFIGIIVSCGPTVSVDAQQSSRGYAVDPEPMDSFIDRSWQIGGFAAGGFPPYYTVHLPLEHYHEELLFYNAGLEAGRMVTAIHGPNFFRGRGEAFVEVIPYWQVNHPGQTVTVYLPRSSAPSFLATVGAYSIHGASITPLQFRWNFLKKDTSRFVPWVQPGFGFLWTNQSFPQGYGDAQVPPVVRASHINFTPQVGFGENIFLRRNQSMSLGVETIHITNFGLTTYDPGVNVIVEFRAGYSWWR
jgi:hypothetical protein